MYGSETMVGRKKEISKVKAVQIDNPLGIRRMDKIPSARVRELCGVRNGLDEKIDEGILLWFGHVERMEKG